MLNATGINTETYTTAIAYSDLANALSTLAADSIPLNGLSWVVNPAEYGTLQVKDKGTDTGQFLLETGVSNDINQVGTMHFGIKSYLLLTKLYFFKYQSIGNATKSSPVESWKKSTIAFFSFLFPKLAISKSISKKINIKLSIFQ